MFEQEDVIIVVCSKISVRFQLVENCASKASGRNKEEVLGEDLACVDFFAQSSDGETRAWNWLSLCQIKYHNVI